MVLKLRQVEEAIFILMLESTYIGQQQMPAINARTAFPGQMQVNLAGHLSLTRTSRFLLLSNSTQVGQKTLDDGGDAGGAGVGTDGGFTAGGATIGGNMTGGVTTGG
jgi:hypothetical protein